MLSWETHNLSEKGHLLALYVPYLALGESLILVHFMNTCLSCKCRKADGER